MSHCADSNTSHGFKHTACRIDPIVAIEVINTELTLAALNTVTRGLDRSDRDAKPMVFVAGVDEAQLGGDDCRRSDTEYAAKYSAECVM